MTTAIEALDRAIAELHKPENAHKVPYQLESALRAIQREIAAEEQAEAEAILTIPFDPDEEGSMPDLSGIEVDDPEGLLEKHPITDQTRVVRKRRRRGAA